MIVVIVWSDGSESKISFSTIEAANKFINGAKNWQHWATSIQDKDGNVTTAWNLIHAREVYLKK